MNHHTLTNKAWLCAALLFCLLGAAPAFAGWLGIGVDEVTAGKLQSLKLKEERGVEIVSVVPDSPAAKAGLKEHDVVLEYNGQRVESVEQFQRLVRETPAERVVRLQISRDGNVQTVSATLGQLPRSRAFGPDWRVPNPPNPPNPPAVIIPRINPPRVVVPPMNMPDMDQLFQRFEVFGPHIGIVVEQISGQLGEYFGVPGGEGLLVKSVEKDSAAEKAGIKAGDVITKVDGQAVTRSSSLRSALAGKAGKDVPVTLVRNRKEMTVTAHIETPANRHVITRGERL